MIWITTLLFLLGLGLLIKGADLLVKGASTIARRFNISDLAIGLTVVAFGTSTPELFVNVVASLKGSTDIAIGNILGSNIANILLILGGAAIVYPLSVTKGTVWKEIPFTLLATVVLALMANDQLLNGDNISTLSRAEGAVLMCFFLIFLYYSAGIAKSVQGLADHVPPCEHGPLKAAMLIVAGLIGLTLGGKWIVDGAVQIAEAFNMSESLIGLTIIAVGTSLPELATSVMAAYRGNVEIAVGNVVGSNIFNVFFVLGVSSMIKPLPLKPTNTVDILIVLLASLLLFGFMFTGKRRTLDRWEGLIFIAAYAVYVTALAVMDG